MNYIRSLQVTKREAYELSAQAMAQLNELEAYLGSSKFWNDPTVQVKDVLARLAPVRSSLIDLSHLTQPKKNPYDHTSPSHN